MEPGQKLSSALSDGEENSLHPPLLPRVGQRSDGLSPLSSALSGREAKVTGAQREVSRPGPPGEALGRVGWGLPLGFP